MLAAKDQMQECVVVRDNTMRWGKTRVHSRRALQVISQNVTMSVLLPIETSRVHFHSFGITTEFRWE